MASTNKPTPNWADIKARYVVNWEKPADIAKDYDVTPNAISKRACMEEWGKEREETAIEIKEEAKDAFKVYKELSQQVHLSGMTAIAKWMQKRLEENEDTACLEFDGEERLNPAFMEILKASKEAFKGDQTIHLNGNLPIVPIQIVGKDAD